MSRNLIDDIITKNAEEFCFGFLMELNELKRIFDNFEMNLTETLPSIFSQRNLDINFIYGG